MLSYLKAIMTGKRWYYYITFEAKDMEDGGRIKTYQTMVVLQFPDEDTYVRIFREKPSQVC